MEAKKILVVDDEPYALAIVERLLKLDGYAVHAAKNGIEALKIFPKYKPDLVLLDLMMPGMNGEEVCREMKNADSSVKIVYFTAKQFPDSPASFGEKSIQPDGFISKPASSKIILSTISHIFNENNKRQA